MKVETARVLANALLLAADAAEAAGQDEVNLSAELQAMDNAARAELDAAIKRAEDRT